MDSEEDERLQINPQYQKDTEYEEEENNRSSNESGSCK